MTPTPEEPNNSSETDREWEEIVAGRLVPAADNPEHREAEAVRQALLWRHAKNTALTVSPQEASYFYQQLHLQESHSVGFWQRWGRGIIGSLVLLLVGFAAGYGLMRWNASVPTPTNVGTQNLSTTSNAPLNLPSVDSIVPTGHQAAATLNDLPQLIAIPAGQYLMGCSAGWDDEQGGCRDNEFPAHKVNVSSFELGKYEITVGQFKRFVAETQYKTTAESTGEGCTVADPNMAGRWLLHPASNWRSPGFNQTDVHPVVCISWADTQNYIAWLNKTTGKTHRLPTEEEWEYAARGGKVTAFFWGSQPNRNFANYQGQGDLDKWQYTAPVGQFSSNAYGLHDMSGNVWEWVQNCWRANYSEPTLSDDKCIKHARTRRGGAWDNPPPSVRSSYRSTGEELERSYLYGFRVARSLE